MDGHKDDYAPDSDPPPRSEREYLAQRVKELERAHRRWKRGVLAVIAAVLLFLVFGAGFALFRVNLNQARMRAEQAMWEAERARQLAEHRLQQLEAGKQKDQGR